jgi:hypothetical protein
MNETHFTEKDRATLTTLEVKLDRAILDIAALTHSFASKSDLTDVEKRIDNLEDNQKWVVRSIIGIVIMALMALIVTVKI